MNLNKYYFVQVALPPLLLGIKPEISFEEFRAVLKENLHPADFQQFTLLLRPIDLYNIRALWLGVPFSEKGNYTPVELEEALLVRESIPSYLSDFLDRYETVEDRLRFFPFLYAAEYREERTGFLGKYFQFEREVRLILTALRAKKWGRDLAQELQFEDPLDPLVMQILAQKEAVEYSPPREYEDLKALFVENDSEPEKLYRAFLQYRFEKIEEMEEGEYFTLDWILGYAARLLLVEEWEQLDREKGKRALEALSRYG